MPTDTAIDPRALLAHARQLATTGAGDGSAASRRAVSAAYYAVFHAVTLAVAQRLAPASSDETRYRLARSVEHGRVAEVCDWLTKEAGGRRHVLDVVGRLRRNRSVVDLAGAFVALMAERHTADYDHLASFDGPRADSACRAADRALALLEELRGTPDLDELLALVALNTALR